MSCTRSAALAALLALSPLSVFAGGSGVLSVQLPTLTYTGAPMGTPFVVPNPTSQAGANMCFDEVFTCDVYRLTVSLPDNYGKTNPYGLVAVSISWPFRTNDFELFVHEGNEIALDSIIAGNSSSKNPEIVTFPALPGTHEYTIVTFPNIITVPDTIAGTVYLTNAQAPYPQKGPKPKFTEYRPPADAAQDAPEPTLDVNPLTGNVFFVANTTTYKVALDETKPGERFGTSAWTDVTGTTTGLFTLDPILTGDQATGRIFVSHLAGATSLLEFTDDDGATWTPSEGSGIPGGVDHQALGAGPYPEMFQFLSANPLYPNALYYCSQDLFTALCARSDTGGLTFAAPIPIYTTECAGIHGHVKVAPDGTVYVPNSGCFVGGVSRQAVVVSEDAGLTWDIRLVTEAVPSQGTDPSVSIARDGTVYFGYHAYDGHARIAVSRDKGLTWDTDTDVSAPMDVQNVVFPAVIAGDGDRAAFAFHGSTTRGAAISESYTGIWHLYIATTYDGGQNWVTVNATPDAPVQREGGICLSGIGCSGNNRNLLDFMDATVDAEGRVLVAYADGCVGECEKAGPNSFTRVGSIVRQSDGPRLFAEFDKPKVATPTPTVAATAGKQGKGLFLGAFAPLMLLGFLLAVSLRARQR